MSSTSGSQEDSVGWHQEKQVPVNQGVFVYDLKTKKNVRVARMGVGLSDFSDFLYWNFSGRAPSAGDGTESAEDGELARWRSASFMAVSSKVVEDKNDEYHAAFKARIGVTDGSDVYVSPVDGIYLRKGKENNPLSTLVKTDMDVTVFDIEAIDTATQSILPVTEMGIERDGFRGNSLAVNVSMGSEEAGWAGIYLLHLSTH